jgi:LysR family transcriptional regulator for bpeEF and oprC
VLDWANYQPLASGALVPVLTDWEALEAPPLYLSYRPSARRLARVRLFVQFVEDLVRGWTARGKGARVGRAPSWAGSTAARASAIGRKGRRA